ncbi:hypothetical protein K461DRAFT_264216 [Myriangium duriaei CBS 260.36]|uniref:Uncharacterized protein n=1 Tax=Myriangium duriaei CBS 260.36 TaxID=1168546 RepID=A0A9P4JAX4_9PEZI|nr:hypothetical protein K461DRAFT_264216 [Myriangium duriaei CBS 260.36]
MPTSSFPIHIAIPISQPPRQRVDYDATREPSYNSYGSTDTPLYQQNRAGLSTIDSSGNYCTLTSETAQQDTAPPSTDDRSNESQPSTNVSPPPRSSKHIPTPFIRRRT